MVYRYRTFHKVSITVECQSFWTLGIFHKDLTIRESFWSNKFTVEYFTKLVFLGTGDIPRSEGILGQKYFFIVEEDFTKRVFLFGYNSLQNIPQRGSLSVYM